MITGYLEYKFKREEVKKDMAHMKAKKVYVTVTVEELHEIEVFETDFPECKERYEEEIKVN